MNLNLDDLEATARAATPGPWLHYETAQADNVVTANGGILTGTIICGPTYEIRNAKFIAASDPPTVIALIERLERAEAREACLRKGRTHRDIRPGLPRRQAPSLYANGLE